jgi:tripartite-type tricarboxylate transporter receptor subunit TctC
VTVNKLNAEINKILTSPDNQKKLKELGVSYKPMTADEFNTFVKSEETKWAQVAKLVGIEPE